MKEMLTTVEENTLYSRFGLIDELSEQELETIDGGIVSPWCPQEKSTPPGGGPTGY